MPITYDRSVCCDLNETISREWLVTNGLGGYAAGTVSGVLTRMQQGLLVASAPNATTPQLFLAKIDEEVIFDQRTYYLGTNEYRDGTLNPSGFVLLETFRLEEGFPIFTYRLGGIDGLMLEKRIWMPQGRNTTYIQYRVLRTATADGNGYRRSSGAGAPYQDYSRYNEYTETSQRALTLTLLPFSAYRPHDKPQYGSNDWHFQVQQHHSEDNGNENGLDYAALLPKGVIGCTIRAWEDAHPYHILAVGHPDSQTTFIPTGVWYWKFLHRHDAAASRPPTDDLYLPGVIRTTLWPAEDASLTIIVSTEELSSQLLRPNQLNLSYRRSVEWQQRLLQNAQQSQRFFGEGGEAARPYHFQPLPLSTTANSQNDREELLSFLLQAGNRFMAQYRLPQNDFIDENSFLFGKSESIPYMISDYYAMESRTRDTLIALPGLMLTTHRYDEALQILRSISRQFKQGMLPDHLSLPHHPSQNSHHTSVDTMLWFCYALDHYLLSTRNYDFLDEVYHRLSESLNWYIHGTDNGIRMDPDDGLLAIQPRGKALTWMNAVVDNIPVTPRYGKPVEVNALWYHTLSLMNEWSQHLFRMGRLNYQPSQYHELLGQCKESFQQRFWYADGSYLYDVVDGPDGDDNSLRPNQLFALSLRYPVLNQSYRTRVFESVNQQLLTPQGLRTLAPQEIFYRGRLGIQQDEQQHSLHQGSVWSWLIGPYVDAMLALDSVSSTQHYQQTVKEHLWHRGVHLLEPFYELMHKGLLGMVSGVYDGDAPHKSAFCVASATGVGELLRVYETLARIQVKHQFRFASV